MNLFTTILPASARFPEIPREDDLYGRLIGSWDLEVVSHDDEGEIRQSAGEVHVARVLEGRAVQDVFINPRRSDRGPGMPAFANWFGTTLRLYDPMVRVWRIWWFNPYDGVRAELTGRFEGDRIVQEGTFPDGTPIRWTFSDITADSFLWRGERMEPDKTWKLQVEMRGRRMRRSARPAARAAARSTPSHRGVRPAGRARFSTRRPARRS